MDPSSHAHGVNQDQPDGPGVNDFYDQLQTYSNFPPGHNPDFDFAWNNGSLFETPDTSSAYGQSSTEAWHNDTTLSQPIDHSMQSYAQSHPQPFQQPSQFRQPQYDARPPSQTAFDPRSILQPSPSPGPQQGYQYQQPLYLNAYGQGREYGQPPQQTTPSSQRPPVSTPSFSPGPSPSPYMRYAIPPAQQHNFQHMNAGSFGSFPVQENRPVQSFVDPNLLTARNYQSQPGHQFQHGFQQIQGQAMPHSPVTGQQQQQPALATDVSGQATQSLQLQAPDGTTPLVKPEKPKKSKKDPNAPKRPRGRPRKDGTMPQAKATSTASTSETDSELEIEEAPEPLPQLLQGSAPQDPVKHSEWATLQAVWSPRNKPAVVERIRHGIAAYGELLKRLRNNWETQNEVLKKAELNNAPTDDLRRQVAESRTVVERVMITTLEWGHPSHIRKLGENHWTMLAMRAFLTDRVTATDWDGSLVLNILKVVARFETLDQEMLDKVKMEKILARFAKKSSPEIKALVQQVLSNAAAATQRKATVDSPEPSRSTPPVVSSPMKNSPQLAGTKRLRDELAGDRPLHKKVIPTKVIPEASKPLALQNALAKKAEAASKAAKPEQTNGTSAAAKPKVAVSAQAAKPVPSVFSSLVSASKKPGTSNAARAAAAAKEKAAAEAAPKKESPPPTTAPSSTAAPRASAFSFTQTLAGLNKPKEVEQKKVEDYPDETEEEKAKRLRKETRRRLRVTWKPDENLTEIRIFTHHPDEEVGHADSMTRDMDDVGGEGRMLKMHKDLDEIDEDEETKAVGEDVNGYSPPSEVEFEGIEEDERNRNYIKRGGKQEPDSPEKVAQEQREQTTLMVVYALPSEIPPSPKEPPAGTDDENYDPPTPFGEPTEAKVRARERQYYASQQSANGNGMNPQTDLSAIFARAGSQQQNPPQAKPLTDLERTFGLYSQMPPQPQPQPQAPAAPAGGFDLTRLLAAVQQSQQPPQPLPYSQPQPQPAAASATPDLASLLASLQSQQQQSLPTQPSFPFLAQPQQPSFDQSDYNPGRKHGREDGDLDGERGRDEAQEEYEERQRKKQMQNYKTVVCRFWKEGKCKKGDGCTYIHD